MGRPAPPDRRAGLTTRHEKLWARSDMRDRAHISQGWRRRACELCGPAWHRWGATRTLIPSPLLPGAWRLHGASKSYDEAMTAIPVPDELAQRLAQRALREGVPEDALVEQALREFLDQDPYEFFEVASSDRLRGATVDERLEESGFGRPRS